MTSSGISSLHSSAGYGEVLWPARDQPRIYETGDAWMPSNWIDAMHSAPSNVIIIGEGSSKHGLGAVLDIPSAWVPWRLIALDFEPRYIFGSSNSFVFGVSTSPDWTEQSGTFLPFTSTYEVTPLSGPEYVTGHSWLRPAPFFRPRSQSERNWARSLRDITGLPVSTLAIAVGVSRAAYHAWLSGVRPGLDRGALLRGAAETLDRLSNRFRDNAAFKSWLRSLPPKDMLASDDALSTLAKKAAVASWSGRRPRLPLFNSGEGGLAERIDEAMRGFGEH